MSSDINTDDNDFTWDETLGIINGWRNHQPARSRLSAAFEGLHKLYEEWPKETELFHIIKPPIAGVPHPQLSLQQFNGAIILWDIHSMICANMLISCWRAEQLGRTLIKELDESHLIVGANLARSLLESSSAFLVESRDVRESWMHWKAEKKTFTNQNLVEFRLSMLPKVNQFTFGTRDKRLLTRTKPENSDMWWRTNILTLIDKAAKQTDTSDLRSMYDELCDTVHPAQGAYETFLSTLYTTPGQEALRMTLSREPRGRSWAPAVICESAIWALTHLTSALAEQKNFCDDLCREFKFWALNRTPGYSDYFGITRPIWAK